MRQAIIFTVALLALFGSLVSALATRDLRDFELRGYVDATQDVDLPYRLPRLGVNADLLQYTPQQLRQHLDWMQQANIVWVRQMVAWDAIEVQAGIHDWTPLDNLFATLADYPHLRPVIVLYRTPQWARTDDNATAPPDDLSDFANFARSFAARYTEQVDYYQIWDEPNLDDAWGLSDPRPAKYAALLAEAYTAIHAVDSDATVILAALAPTTERNGRNIADTIYLEALYATGAKAYFDAVAAKPYGFDLPPDDRRVSIDRLNFSRIIALREIMVAHGDGHKALWASQWGWNSLPDDWTGSSSVWGQVSATQQQDYALAALQRAEREWPWLGGMILHHWQPNRPTDDPQWGFAVIDQNNDPTNLWHALVNYETGDAATNGLYHPRTTHASYSGLWTFSEIGADIGWLETSDSQLAFDFYGRAVSLLLREDDYFAFLYPTIDGQAANATPQDASGNAYLLLRSATKLPEINLVPIARDLSNDRHTLRVIADKGWDRWALAGYAVSNGDLAAPYNRQIMIAWGTACAALLASMVSAVGLPWRRLIHYVNQPLQQIHNLTQGIVALVTSLALMIGMLMTFGAPDPNMFRREALDSLLMTVITGGLLVVELPFLLVIGASLVLFWLIYHRLLWGVILVILYAPFFLFPIELYTFAFPMAELLTYITAAAWTLKMLVRWGIARQTANSDYPTPLPHLTSIDIALLVWGSLGTLALFWSAYSDVAFTEWRTLFIDPLLFYGVLRTSIKRPTDLRTLSDTLVVAGLLVAVIGIILFITGEAIITAEGGTQRLASVYGSPNNVGLLLGRCLPFALSGLLIAPERGRRWFYGVAWLVMSVATLLTQSVGTILIGVPVGFALVILLTFKQRAIPPLLFLAILGAAAALVLTQISARFASLLDLSSGTNFIRLRLWESTIEILSKHPLRGLGLDQFLYVYRGHYVRPDAIADADLSHPHNLLFDVWIRLGIAGVIWLLAFITVFWRRMINLWQDVNHPSSVRQVIVGAMGAMAALIAHGMIDNSIYVNDLAFIFMLIAGIAACLDVEVT